MTFLKVCFAPVRVLPWFIGSILIVAHASIMIKAINLDLNTGASSRLCVTYFSFSWSILLPEDCYLHETWSCNKCFEVQRNHYECQPLCQRLGYTYDIVRKTRSTDLCKSYRK